MSDIITLENDRLQVRLLARGATLTSLRFAGQSRNLVLGYVDPADHARIPGFAGHLAGPVANRVRAGRVVIDGETFQMPLNEGGRTCLHSGVDGVHAQVWACASQNDNQVTFACTLQDGQNGLPGNRAITAQYAVTGSTLRLTIRAQSDKSTPINIASHPYWNLDGAADVSGHSLEVAAHSYLPTDAHNLPTGEIRPVDGTPLNFRRPKAVPLDPTLDLNFCLSETMADTPAPVATLRGRDGTSLHIATTCPGLQVYTGAHLPDMPVAMADCPPLAPFAGIALEPQHWPDAPHHSHFPQITLHPGETYQQITEYRLTPR